MDDKIKIKHLQEKLSEIGNELEQLKKRQENTDKLKLEVQGERLCVVYKEFIVGSIKKIVDGSGLEKLNKHSQIIEGLYVFFPFLSRHSVEFYLDWHEYSGQIDKSPVEFAGASYMINEEGILMRADTGTRIYSYQFCLPYINCQDDNLIRYKHNKTIVTL